MPQPIEGVRRPPLTFEVKQEPRNSTLSPSAINKTASTWLPVSPVRTPSGALASLSELLGEDKAHPLPPGDISVLSSFSEISGEVDLPVAAKLGIGSIFSGTLKQGDRAFYLDATEFIDVYTESPSTPICGTRWGVGLRVLLHVSDVKDGLALNFGLVGAAVELGLVKARYEIDGMGIEEGLSVVLGDLRGSGDLTSEIFYGINDCVMPKLAAYIKNNGWKLTPVPYQVQLNRPMEIDPIHSAQSIDFRLRRQREGCLLDEALAKAAGKHDQHGIDTNRELDRVFRRVTCQTYDPDSTPCF